MKKKLLKNLKNKLSEEKKYLNSFRSYFKNRFEKMSKNLKDSHSSKMENYLSVIQELKNIIDQQKSKKQRIK